MAIRFYDAGEHPAGFRGWRVIATVRGRYYQKYLSIRPPSRTIDPDYWLKYQETRARYYEARWQARSAAVQYIDFISRDHPTTAPKRGLGFCGITIGISEANRHRPEGCHFQTANRRIAITNDKPLSQAWNDAVDLWAKAHDLREKDVAHRRANPPSPDVFKALRRHMNEVEGYNIPAWVLGPVYAEQRAEIEHRATQKALKRDLDNGLTGFHNRLQHEIENYKGRLPGP